MYFLHHRELLGELSRAAAETAKELLAAAAMEEKGFRPGLVAVVQTFGDRASFRPHVHARVTRGGWAGSGEWVPVPYVDERAAEELFRHKVLGLLRRRVPAPGPPGRRGSCGSGASHTDRHARLASGSLLYEVATTLRPGRATRTAVARRFRAAPPPEFKFPRIILPEAYFYNAVANFNRERFPAAERSAREAVARGVKTRFP